MTGVQTCALPIYLARSYHRNLQEILSLRQPLERSGSHPALAWSWDDITGAFERAKASGRTPEEILALRRTRSWDEVDRLYAGAKQWSIPLNDLLRARENWSWDDVTTSLNLGRQYNRPWEALLGLRETRSADEVRLLLETEKSRASARPARVRP